MSFTLGADLSARGILLSSSGAPRRAAVLAAAVTTGVIAGVVGTMGMLVMLALAVVGVAMIRWPGLIFAAYLLLPFYKGVANPYLPVDLTVSLAVMNGLQFVWILGGGWRRLPRRPAIAWLALAVVVVAGAASAADWGQAGPRAAEWVALLLLPSLAAVRIVAEPRHVRHVVAAVLGMGLLTVAIAIPEIGGSARLVVTEQNTIQVAVAALFVPLIGMAFLSTGSRLTDLALVILAPLSLMVAVATGSRGPLLAAATVALGALAIHVANRGGVDRRTATYLALSAAVVAIALTVFDIPEASLSRYATLGELFGPAGETGGSVLGVRGELFSAALRLFWERPIFGYGTGSFASYASATVGLTDLPYPHNIPLQVAAELGVVGLLVVAILLVSAAIRTLPPGPFWLALRVLFVFLFLESLVSGDLYTDRMLWGLVVLLLLAPSLVRSDRRPAPVT